MKADKMYLLRDVIEKNKRVFKIPVYQRNYDWTNIQCEKLYQDIILAEKSNKEHFMGTIVYIDDITGGSGLTEVLIIDGQQRITTMYILLKALYDMAKGISTCTENEINDIMFNRHCDEKYKVKLKPVKSDNEQLKLLFNDEIDLMDRNSNIYKNYIYFKKMIHVSINNDLELIDIFTGMKKLVVVEIILDKNSGDEPQKIFESINSTGVELSLADLIRNYLLMDDVKQDELYEKYWLEIEKNVEYSKLEDFFIDFLNAYVNSRKVVTKKYAYEIFKIYFKENISTHEELLKQLQKVSKCYSTFFGTKQYYNDRISKYLHSFCIINQKTVIPFLFRLLDDYEDKHISEEVLCKILDYLLTYIIRIIACDINKNLNKFMYSLYNRVFDGTYKEYYEKFVTFINELKANDRMPTDDEFYESLMNNPLYKKHICKFMLSVIENSSKEQLNVNDLTIEHILPQKENSVVWKKELGDEYNQVYEKYLHTLGNLTITGHNSELGTKTFSEKKKIIKDNSKANILNKEILSATKWNEKAIRNRAKVLSKILIKEFPYVAIKSKEPEKVYLNFVINSDIDFTDTKPKEFIFNGELIEVESWGDLLINFISCAYDLNAALFADLAIKNYKIKNASSVYITNDERCLRRGKEIENSGIYIETNLSTKRTAA